MTAAIPLIKLTLGKDKEFKLKLTINDILLIFSFC